MMGKIARVCMLCVLVFSLCVPAFALNVSEEIASVPDAEANGFVATATATMIGEDGETITVPVEVTTTTREIQSTRNTTDGSKVYETTALATYAADKSDSNTNEKEYVTASGTIFWRDILGTGNQFLGASGSWAVATNPNTGSKATLSNRYAALQGVSSATDRGEVYKIWPGSNSFEIDDAVYADGFWAYGLQTEVTINKSETLTLKVSTGLL